MQSKRIETAPSISAIITCYNSADTIGAAIDSVLAQTHPPEEIIVVDDGSSDASPEVIESFGDKVSLIVQENRGPSAARNRGLAAARGEWIAFLDGDDLWHPDKLAMQLVAMENFADAAVIATDWSRDKKNTYASENPRVRRVYASEIAVLNRYQTSTVLARREALEAAGGFNPDLDAAEDWDLWLRIAEQASGILIRLPLVVYRDNPGGVSKNLRKLALLAEVIMDREATQGYFSPHFISTLSAWHNQRFVVAALLNRDLAQATQLAMRSKRRAPFSAHLRAFSIYTMPFLISRLKSRSGNSKAIKH